MVATAGRAARCRTRNKALSSPSARGITAYPVARSNQRPPWALGAPRDLGSKSLRARISVAFYCICLHEYKAGRTCPPPRGICIQGNRQRKPTAEEPSALHPSEPRAQLYSFPRAIWADHITNCRVERLRPCWGTCNYKATDVLSPLNFPQSFVVSSSSSTSSTSFESLSLSLFRNQS